MSTPPPGLPAAPTKRKFSRHPAVQAATAGLARGAAGLLHWLGPDRGGALASAVARRVLSPLVPESRLALASIAKAFPGTTEAERRAILAGAWDNLARAMAELRDLPSLVLKDPSRPEAGLTDRFEVVGAEWVARMRDDGRAGIVFLAHVGNWEVLAPAALAHGLRFTGLYRPPRNARIAADLARWRGGIADLIVSGPGAAARVARALRNGAHLAMQMDQRLAEAQMVPFLGRPAPTNPIVGRLARQFDCPVHGARSIRLPGGRFRLEMTPPLDLPRDASGRVDVEGATAAITAVIEGWVREHPEQWFWLHDRWGDRKKQPPPDPQT